MNDFKKQYRVEITNIIKEEMKNIRVDDTLTNKEKMLELRALNKVIDKFEEEER